MGRRTPDEYRAGLRDGRRLDYRGQRVPDITRHPERTPATDLTLYGGDRPELDFFVDPR